METLIFHSDSKKKSDALKAVAKALDIEFETREPIEEPYNPEFVAKILESRKQFESGQHKIIEIEDLWK